MAAPTLAHHPNSARRGGPLRRWAFRYVFFSNNTPFDAPNRSEPCPVA